MLSLVRRLADDIVGAHVDGTRTIRRLPLLFSVVIGAEIVQHVVEVRIGLYRDAATAHALSLDASRITFGLVKMALFYAAGLFVTRRLIADAGDVPLAPLGTAATRYLPYLCYSMMLVTIILCAPVFVGEGAARPTRVVASLFQLLLEPALVAWIVASATDGRVRTPVRSLVITGSAYPWALAVFFIGRIPSNAVHQFLARAAVGHGGVALWIMLAFDAASVGLIAAIVPALYVRIARFIRERRLPGGGRVEVRRTPSGGTV